MMPSLFPLQASSQKERKRDFEKIFAHYDVVRMFFNLSTVDNTNVYLYADRATTLMG